VCGVFLLRQWETFLDPAYWSSKRKHVAQSCGSAWKKKIPFLFSKNFEYAVKVIKLLLNLSSRKYGHRLRGLWVSLTSALFRRRHLNESWFWGIGVLFEMKSECQRVYVDLRESKYWENFIMNLIIYTLYLPHGMVIKYVELRWVRYLECSKML
jgi:hypothetical protein